VSSSRVPFVRLGYLATIQSGITVDGNRDHGSDSVTLPYVRVANVQDGHLDLGTITEIRVARAVARSAMLRCGDVLMTEGGDLDKLGRGTVWNGEIGNCLHQNHVFAVRPDRSRLMPEYLALITQTSYARAYFESTGTKTTNLASTSSSKIRDFRIPFVDLDEQRRIVDFLDAETGRIDQLMNAQLRVLDLLEERANSRILKLIGQSLLVRSDGAAIVPMRRVIKKLSRPVISTNEVITAFRDGQVTSRSIRRSEGYTLAASKEPQGQGVETGDIVVHGLDGFAGAIGDSEASGNCSPVYHVCIPIDGGNSAFYGRLLRLLALNDYLALFGASARERAVDFRNWQIFGHAQIPKVSPREQHEIGGLITKIRPLREEVRRFNERLAERRRALITANLIGQFDFTTTEGSAV
jgi:type I restriction enzyme, S subunit